MDGVSDCLVCAALRDQLALMADLLHTERAEKHEIIRQLVNLADPQALARLRGPQPVKPGEKREVPVTSPAVARAKFRDIPTPEEIAAFAPQVDPAEVRRDIEAEFTKTGT